RFTKTGGRPRSSLDADDLPEAGHDLDEVGGLFEDLGDRLVGPGDLVEDAGVLAALHTLGLDGEVFLRELPLRLAAGHLPAGAVGSALEGVAVAEAANDEGAGPHRAGNDSQLPFPRADRALARDEHLFAEMDLVGDVVVVAVDGGRQAQPRDVPLEAEGEGELPQDPVHHDLAVLPRVALAPLDVLAVLAELRRPGEEIGEVGIGQAVGEPLHGSLRLADVDLGDGLSDVAAPRMEQRPEHSVVLVPADLDEVIASAERPELVECLVHELPGRRVGLVAPSHPRHRGFEGLALLLEADRYLPLDRVAELLQAARVEAAGRDGGPSGHPSPA